MAELPIVKLPIVEMPKVKLPIFVYYRNANEKNPRADMSKVKL
jgi:hypothetical protein